MKMASEEHKKLSSFIKNVHQVLRKNAHIMGPTAAWNAHYREQETLQKYAQAMQTLATTFWHQNCTDESKTAQSRIHWAAHQCELYFFHEGIMHNRKREEHVLNIIDENSGKNLYLQNSGINKLKLLDVGSCYNPFKVYDIFNVTAIDIAPANTDVYQCDFLHVDIAVESDDVSLHQHVTKLQACSYEVVVFSLLLEYLPSSEQRLKCCENAYRLLKPECVLIIITPDSKHVGANAKLMKCWRYALARMGFSRIKYEKLPHIHCMVFRKSINNSVTERWADLHKEIYMTLDLNIPQDFTRYSENDVYKCDVSKTNNEEIVRMFLELPNL